MAEISNQSLNPFDLILNELALLRNEVAEIKKTPVQVASSSPEIKEKMNTTELCEYLGVNRITVHNMKKRGAINYYGNRKFTYFMKSEIDASLSSIPKKRKGSKV